MTILRPTQVLPTLLLLLALVGCAAPAPRVEVFHALGSVRADDLASAQRFSQLVTGLQPRISEVVPDTASKSTEVWVQDRLQHRVGQSAPLDVKGFTLISSDKQRGRIHMRSDADYPHWFLSHELVHALLGPTWDTIPAVIEEGLCDVVAAELHDDVAGRIRALRAIEASLFFGKMQVVIEHRGNTPGNRRRETEIWFHYDRGAFPESLEDVLAPPTLDLQRRPRNMGDALYGLGFLVAERIHRQSGLDGLNALCRQAHAAGLDAVPVERLLEAADLSDRDERAKAPRELLGAAEFDSWVELLPGFHADLLLQLFGTEYQGSSVDEFLGAVDPTIVLHDGTRVRVAEHEGVRAQLAARWHVPSLP